MDLLGLLQPSLKSDQTTQLSSKKRKIFDRIYILVILSIDKQPNEDFLLINFINSVVLKEIAIYFKI